MPHGIERIQLLLSRPRLHLKGLEGAVKEVIAEAKRRSNPILLDAAARELNRGRRYTGGHRPRLERIATELRNQIFAEARQKTEELRTTPEQISQPLAQVRTAVATARALTPELIVHLQRSRESIDELRPDVLEHLVGEFFIARQVFEKVALVGRDPSTSADLFCASTLGGEVPVRVFVEVKGWDAKVGIEVIDKVLGAAFHSEAEYGWSAAIIVALNGFKSFRKRGPDDLRLKNLHLKNRDDLLGWLDGYIPNPAGLYLPNPQRALPPSRAR